jgi:hypothetical protein
MTLASSYIGPSLPDVQLKQEVFTANGTWTRPNGVYSIHIMLVAGGSSAGNGTNESQATGGWGGEVIVRILSDLNDATYDVVVGRGGLKTVENDPGTNTTFSNSTTTLLTAIAKVNSQTYAGEGMGGRGYVAEGGQGAYGYGAGGGGSSSGIAYPASFGAGRGAGIDARDNSGGGGGGYYSTSQPGAGGSGICIITWRE